MPKKLHFKIWKHVSGVKKPLNLRFKGLEACELNELQKLRFQGLEACVLDK